MRVGYQVRKQCGKLKKLVSFLRRDFNSSQCKTWAKMTTARIKLLRNKRESIVRQMRRDVALLLQSKQESTARIRVEHVIREQNMMAANDILELFCERLVTRLSIISSHKECPVEVKEAIASLIYAAPRCSDIPELLSLRHIFLTKYGKDFVSAASDLRPHSGVNRLLIEKLSALNPPGELKLKVMKEIATEYKLDWDPSHSESQLLQPPDPRLEGPRTFVSAASLPLKPGATLPYTEVHKPTTRLSDGGSEATDMNFQDVASAAKAAANSAKNAIAAAQAAAELAQKESLDSKHQSLDASSFDQISRSNVSAPSERYHRAQSLGAPNNYSDDANIDDLDFNMRRHSYNVHRLHSDIKFDDSDCDEETDTEQPPSAMYQRPLKQASFNSKAGVVPPVHPKLPDYDTLTARFEELKYRKT